MMFVCYSLALAILGFAYHAPDPTVLIVLLIIARRVLG